MTKDKGTTLPITQLTGLMINYDGNNSTFNMPNVSTAQRDKLVNIEPYKIGNSTYTVKNGTMIFNTDIGNPEIFENGKWYIFQLRAAPGQGTVTSSAPVGGTTVNAITVFTDQTGTDITEYSPGGLTVTGNNLILNNGAVNEENQPTGLPILPTANSQLLVFKTNGNGQTIIPAVKNNGDAVTLVDGKLQAFNPLLKAHKNKREKNDPLKDDFDIPVMALDGIDAINFAGPVGIITMNNGNTDLGFIALSVNPDNITQQNIVFTDKQNITEPSTYDAIVEINSANGALLLPRLSDNTIKAMSNPVAGLTAYNTNSNQVVFYNGTEWVAGEGNVVGPASSTTNAIAIYEDTSGQNLLNSAVTITDYHNINANNTISASSIYLYDPAYQPGFQNIQIESINNGNSYMALNGGTTSSTTATAQVASGVNDGIATFNMSENYTNTSISMACEQNTNPGIIINQNVTGSFVGWPNVTVSQSGIGSSGNYSSQAQMIIDSSGVQIGTNFNTEAGTTANITTTSQGDGTSYLNLKYLSGNGGADGDNALIQLFTQNTGTAFIKLCSNSADANFSNSITLVANSSMTTPGYYVLPGAMPTATGQVLSSDTSGNMSWTNGVTIDSSGNTIISGYLAVNGIGASQPYSNGYGFVNSGGGGNVPGSGSIPAGIYCSNRIVCSELDAVSSINIKTILEDTPNINEIIDLFSQINIKKYEYTDKFQYGVGVHYGLIAEELQEVMPHIVHDHQDYVPNIMCKADVTYEDSKNIIVLLESNKNLDDLVGKRIKLYFDSDCVMGLVTSNTNEIINIKFDKDCSEINQVFVYGTEENCPSVAKERLFEMNLVVTQNLLKRLAVLEQRLGV